MILPFGKLKLKEVEQQLGALEDLADEIEIGQPAPVVARTISVGTSEADVDDLLESVLPSLAVDVEPNFAKLPDVEPRFWLPKNAGISQLGADRGIANYVELAGVSVDVELERAERLEEALRGSAS